MVAATANPGEAVDFRVYADAKLSSPAVPMSALSCVLVPIDPDRWLVYEPTYAAM